MNAKRGFTHFAKYRKVILLSILAVLVIVAVTAIVTTYVVEKRYNLEYLTSVDSTLEETTESLRAQSKFLYAQIDCKAIEQPKRYTPLADHAREIESATKDIIGTIDSIKRMIIVEADGEYPSISRKLSTLDDFSAARKVMKGDDMEDLLNSNLESYRDLLLSTIEDTSFRGYKAVDEVLCYQNSSSGIDKNLTNADVFYKNIPAIATIVLLSKLQADIIIAENQTLGYLVSFLSGDIRITPLKGIAIVPKPYVRKGENYYSKIFLGAVDPYMEPRMYLTYDYPFYDSINEDGRYTYVLNENASYDLLPLSSEGAGLHKIKCDKTGIVFYGGLIHYSANCGEMWIPFQSNYYVGDF